MKITGHFLGRRQPRPDVGSSRIVLGCSLQIGKRPSRFAVLAIINSEEKIRAGQRGLKVKRTPKLDHRFGNLILKLVDQSEIHMNFSKIGSYFKHGPVLSHCGNIITVFLGLLRSGKVRFYS
jgi:hypothetical protein